MLLIGIIDIIIYFIAIAWSWHNLGGIEKSKKVAFIIIGNLIMYLVTLIIFQTTKNNIAYQNQQMQKDVQNMIVTIFTGVNGIIILPQIAVILDEINEKQIDKDVIVKKIIIIAIIFIIGIILETGYLRNIQEGIISIYRSRVNG